MSKNEEIAKQLLDDGRITQYEYESLLGRVSNPDQFNKELLNLYKNKANQYLMTSRIKIRLDSLEHATSISKEEAEAIAMGYFYSYIAAVDEGAAFFHFLMTSPNIVLIPLGLSSIINFLKREKIDLNEDPAIQHLFHGQRALFEAIAPIWLLINDLGIENVVEIYGSPGSTQLAHSLINGLIAYQQFKSTQNVDDYIQQLQWLGKYCQEDILQTHFQNYFLIADKNKECHQKIASLFKLEYLDTAFSLDNVNDRLELWHGLVGERKAHLADERVNLQLKNQVDVIYQSLKQKFAAACEVPLSCCVCPGAMRDQYQAEKIQAESTVQERKAELLIREAHFSEVKTSLEREVSSKKATIANLRKEVSAEYQADLVKLNKSVKALLEQNRAKRAGIAVGMSMGLAIGNGPPDCSVMPIIRKS